MSTSAPKRFPCIRSSIIVIRDKWVVECTRDKSLTALRLAEKSDYRRLPVLKG
jgi:hypothetical protein